MSGSPYLPVPIGYPSGSYGDARSIGGAISNFGSYDTGSIPMPSTMSPQGGGSFLPSQFGQDWFAGDGNIPGGVPGLDLASPAGVTAGGAPNWSMWDRLFGAEDGQGNMIGGAVLPTVQTLTGLGNLWLGKESYDLAKDSFKENKRQFGMNFDAQRRTTNAELRDRQRARVASNPGAYQSVGDYMDQNGVR